MIKLGDRVIGGGFSGTVVEMEDGWVYFDNGHAFLQLHLILYFRLGWEVEKCQKEETLSPNLESVIS